MSGKATAGTETTERVLAAMLSETLELMSEVIALGDERAASGHAGPHETAVYLRLGARLSRIGAWILANESGGEAEKREASAILRDALRREELDAGADIGPLSAAAARIDRLAARAVRLEELLKFGRVDTGAAQRRPGWRKDMVLSEPRVLEFRRQGEIAD